MAVALSGQDIVSSSGSNTWADIVALGSTKLTSFSVSGSKALYRWTGEMSFTGTAEITISDQVIELFGTDASNKGRISATGSAKVTFTNCSIICTLTSYYTSVTTTSDNSISQLFCSRSGDASAIELTDCQILFSDLNLMSSSGSSKRIPIAISKALRTQFISEVLYPTTWIDAKVSNSVKIYVKESTSDIEDCVFKNSWLWITVEGTIKNNKFIDSVLALYSLTSKQSRIEGFDTILENPDATGIASFYPHGGDFINPGSLDFTVMTVEHANTGQPIAEHQKIYQQYLKLLDEEGAIENGLVVYSGYQKQFDTSNSLGILDVFELVGERTNIASLTPPAVDYTLYTGPVPIVDHSAYTQKILSYSHDQVKRNLSINAPSGTSSLPTENTLIFDTGITQTNYSTVAAYTGFTHTDSGITIASNKTLEQLYDHRKYYWRDRINQGATQNIFGSATPAIPNATDGTTYEMGMKFRASIGGQITKIRYYKASSETGSHTGRIWSAAGTELASVVFTGETSSGWQEQALATPLDITANTTYVVSVNVNSHYVATGSGLSSSVVNGYLSTVADGANGVFGAIGTFPTGSFSNGNYFRDVVFLGPDVDGAIALDPPQRVGDTADFGDKNITLNAVLTIDGKFEALKLSGTLSIGSSGAIAGTNVFVDARGDIILSHAGDYDAPVYTAATTTITVTSGNTNLSSWVIAEGTTIDNSSASSAIVQVASAYFAGITVADPTTGGGSITLVAPLVVLTIAVASSAGSVTGAELRIYDLDGALPSLGTELTGTETMATSSFEYEYDGSKAGDTVFLQIIADGYEEFGQSITLPSSNTTFNAVLTTETNI